MILISIFIENKGKPSADARQSIYPAESTVCVCVDFTSAIGSDVIPPWVKLFRCDVFETHSWFYGWHANTRSLRVNGMDKWWSLLFCEQHETI